MQLNMIEVPGYEADDVIGSICRSALDQRAACLDAKDYCQIDLATPDKDFFQLLGPEVRMLRPQKKNRESSVNGIACDVYSEDFCGGFWWPQPPEVHHIQALAETARTTFLAWGSAKDGSEAPTGYEPAEVRNQPVVPSVLDQLRHRPDDSALLLVCACVRAQHH